MEKSSDTVFYELKDVKFKKITVLDLTRYQQLPSYKYLIERYLTLLNEKPKTLLKKKEVVIKGLADEFRSIWIFMSIPPQTLKTVVIYTSAIK